MVNFIRGGRRLLKLTLMQGFADSLDNGMVSTIWECS